MAEHTHESAGGAKKSNFFLSVKFIVAVIFVVAVVSYAFTYSVKFNEAAVVTTWGKAGEGAVREKPGLGFKIINPIQSVTKYDVRARFLAVQVEQVQTADSRPITMSLYTIWRVDDPLEFFQSYSEAGPSSEDHYKKAEDTLRSIMRAQQRQISKFRFDQMFTSSGSTVLPQAEAMILEAMQGEQVLQKSGIRPLVVGINSIELPTTTTGVVFERMKTDRISLVNALQSKGAAEANAITQRAQADAEKIRAFAKALASEIRAQGDSEAAQWVARMADMPDLVTFLQKLDMYASVLLKRATIVVSTSESDWNLLDPDSMTDVPVGVIPGSEAAVVAQNGKREKESGQGGNP